MRYCLGPFGRDALRAMTFTSEEIGDMEDHFLELREFFTPQQNVIAESHISVMVSRSGSQEYSNFIHKLKIKGETCLFHNNVHD